MYYHRAKLLSMSLVLMFINATPMGIDTIHQSYCISSLEICLVLIPFSSGDG